jgi:hypothetical protein
MGLYILAIWEDPVHHRAERKSLQSLSLNLLNKKMFDSMK